MQLSDTMAPSVIECKGESWHNKCYRECLDIAFRVDSIKYVFVVNPTINLSSLRCHVYYMPTYCKLWSFDIAKAVTLDQVSVNDWTIISIKLSSKISAYIIGYWSISRFIPTPPKHPIEYHHSPISSSYVMCDVAVDGSDVRIVLLNRIF